MDLLQLRMLERQSGQDYLLTRRTVENENRGDDSRINSRERIAMQQQTKSDDFDFGARAAADAVCEYFASAFNQSVNGDGMARIMRMEATRKVLAALIFEKIFATLIVKGLEESEKAKAEEHAETQRKPH